MISIFEYLIKIFKFLNFQDEFQQQKWSKCATIRKNFYIEDPEVAQLSKEMVEQIRAENKNITVQYTFDEKTADSAEHKIPNPVQTFEQAFRVKKIELHLIKKSCKKIYFIFY